MIKEFIYTIGKNLGLINDTNNKPTIHVKPENPEREKLKKEEKLKKLNKELTILKWLISYQYPSASHNKYDGELRYEMIYSCKKLNVIKDTDNFHLTDSKYEKIIYDYAINTLPDMIETNCVANIDHKILLYVYTSLTARKGSDSTSANAFLSNIINCSEKDLTRKFRPAENVIPGSKLKGSFYKKGYIKYCHKTYFLIKFNKNLPDWVQDTCPKQPSDYLYKMDFAERIIFALYLWISDISIINQYSEYMNLLQNDTKFYENTVDHISEENIEIIWKNCKDFSFRYDYFYRKKNNSKTPEKLEFIIKNYIKYFTEKKITFAPSLITLLFNSLDPDKIKRIDIQKYTVCPYVFPISETSKNTDWDYLSLLKMVILKPVKAYTHNEKYSIDARFQEEKSKFIIQDVNNTKHEYICLLHDEEKTIVNDLLLSSQHEFHFTYSYFNIFIYIYENKNMFRAGEKMNFSLSLLHLNAATKWFDAFMLINNMPFAFRNYNLLYLKMLSIYPEYQSIIENLSTIFYEISEKEILFKYNSNTIHLKNFISQFYEKSEQKLNLYRLIDIVKTKYNDLKNRNKTIHNILLNKSDERIHWHGINPVYKWICLLEHSKIDEGYLEYLLHSGYIEFCDKKVSFDGWKETVFISDSDIF